MTVLSNALFHFLAIDPLGNMLLVMTTLLTTVTLQVLLTEIAGFISQSFKKIPQ